jgi:ATP-dependent RNA helicase DDX24/MAK5
VTIVCRTPHPPSSTAQGSGKTLAYGLPILHELLTAASASPPKTKSRRSLRALVLAPTRELALQVSAHLNACLNYQEMAASAGAESAKAKRKGADKGKEKDPSTPRAPPPVSVAAIVGGMSAQKQERILRRGVDVLVATPGRLWDILEGVRQTELPSRKLKKIRLGRRTGGEREEPAVPCLG